MGTNKEIFFREIWDQHSRKIKYFIKLTLQANSHEYDDIFQDIMIKIYIN